MSDYRVKVTVRNNRILKAIEASGGSMGCKWCEEHGLAYGSVNDLVNMTKSPLTATGKLSITAAKLCDVLDSLPEDLWSNEQLYPLEKNFSEVEMNHEQLTALMHNGDPTYLMDMREIEEGERTSVVDDVLGTLKKREEAVIRMRFHEDKTLEECGQFLKISRERVREIQNKALRKLKHVTRLAKLADVADIDDDHLNYIKNDYEKYKFRNMKAN